MGDLIQQVMVIVYASDDEMMPSGTRVVAGETETNECIQGTNDRI